ncbi:MAG: hypothetical protein CXZ00_10415 [Acidobacteria bacterium]|nr:MAG: hypothetical protein CXZ00_10415 [Acidobacteriota bacterium]
MNRSIPALLLVTVLALTVSCKKVSQDAQASVALPGTGTPPPTSSTRTAADAPAPTFATSSAAGDAVASNPSSIPQSPISEPAPAADDAAGSDYARTSYRPLEIPAGTPVSIRLQSSISSASASRGDRFHAVLDSPLLVDGHTVAPSGAKVTGKVVAAEHSGRLRHPGMLQLELSSMRVAGKEVAITTSKVTARGASHKKRNLAWIGGGAGGGALLGGLMGGGKGALIGSAVGAGAGTATAAATGKHDVAFNAERQLTFRLRQPVEVR